MTIGSSGPASILTPGGRDADRMRGIRHELGNLLTAIRGYALLMQEDAEAGTDVDAFSGKILNLVERGERLLEGTRVPDGADGADAGDPAAR